MVRTKGITQKIDKRSTATWCNNYIIKEIKLISKAKERYCDYCEYKCFIHNRIFIHIVQENTYRSHSSLYTNFEHLK